MTSPRELPARKSCRPALLTCGAGICLLAGAGVYLHFELRAMREAVAGLSGDVGRLEAAVQLLRIEQSVEGKGIDAVLEMLDAFAPHLQRQTPMTSEYEARKEEILRAVGELGPSSYPRIVAHFRASEPVEDDELRKLLLEAAARADPDRAPAFLASIVRGLDPDYLSLTVTPRNRRNAVPVLAELEPGLCGDVLAEIFSYESARGVNVAKVPFHLKDKVPAAGMGNGFENLLRHYLVLGHERTEEVLIQILKGSEHNLLSKQECVKALGDLPSRSRAAAEAIKKAYLEDAGAEANPLFLNHCLEAIGKILRGEACGFFREQQSKVKHELVLNKLNALLLEHC